jgi:pimeloyl-ACP methyl ester carboxylesterase
MYLNSFGGSGLLHILAGHPRLVAGLGLVGAVALLASPVGPGTYRGTAKYASAIERSIHDRGSDQAVAGAERQAAGELNGSREELEPIVRRTIATCGAPCGDVTIDSVFADRALLKQVLVLDAISNPVK